VGTVWEECEPCASHPQQARQWSDDPLGLLAGTGQPFCSQTVTLKVSIVSWGEECGWDIDGEIEHPGYTNDDNGELLQYRLNLSTSVAHHVLNAVDYAGDGWGGGYVQLLNLCGQTIAGGPLSGQVWGAGVSLPFETASLCCACRDDGVLMALGTSCPYWMGSLGATAAPT
jgi:hypothetical protein